MKVQTVREKVRGCGYRKPGAGGIAIYLVSDGPFGGCELMPFPLLPCPVCGCVPRFSRSWAWIEVSKLRYERECDPLAQIAHVHRTCVLCAKQEGRQGLLWVGAEHYSEEEFIREANEMGISKRVSSVPWDFEFGRTWVFLAHLKAKLHDGTLGAAIIMAFQPTKADIVIASADKIPPKAEKLVKTLGEKNVRLLVVEPEDEDE